MGAWGIAISSNDTYADIYGDFFNLYNEGFDVAEISKKLISNNQETINDLDDGNNFWFALAKAQWECKLLDKEIFEKVKKIIETGADIEVWKQLDADEKDLKKRKIVLDNFLADIQIERSKAKSRKKKIIRKAVFKKGDCLTFKLKNGNYGGAVVLEAIKNTELGLNLIATTRFNKSCKPTINDIENEEVLVKNFLSWNNQKEIAWYYPILLKRDNIKPEVFGQLKVEIDYNPNDYSLGFFYGGSIDSTIEIIERQFEYEKANLKTENRLTVKQFTIKR